MPQKTRVGGLQINTVAAEIQKKLQFITRNIITTLGPKRAKFILLSHFNHN